MSVKLAITIAPILQSAPIHKDLTTAYVIVALQAMVLSAQVCKMPPQDTRRIFTPWKFDLDVTQYASGAIPKQQFMSRLASWGHRLNSVMIMQNRLSAFDINDSSNISVVCNSLKSRLDFVFFRPRRMRVRPEILPLWRDLHKWWRIVLLFEHHEWQRYLLDSFDAAYNRLNTRFHT